MNHTQDANASEVGLRQALYTDKEFAYEVKKQALGPYVQQVWGWSEDVQLYFHEKGFDPSHLQIITLAGRDIGTIEILANSGRIQINKLYILPEFQRRGIGSKILCDVIDNAQQDGLPMRLGVLKINPAVRFYERHGFQKVEETDTHWKMEWIS